MKQQHFKIQISHPIGVALRAIVLTCVVVLSNTLALNLAFAQNSVPTKIEDRSAFGNPSLTAGRPENTTTNKTHGANKTPGLLDQTWALLRHWQQRINRSLTSAIRAFKTQDALTASLFLVLLSFTYGVLHAAGPGHGKFVISSYVLANERTVKRGIALAFLAAIFQAFSAILIVTTMAVLLNRTGLEIRATEAWITSLSWALVAAIGGWLLLRQMQNIFQTRPVTSHTHTPSQTQNLDHAHHDHHDHTHHDHVHDAHCGCGHAHMPSPHDLQDDKWSWKRALAIAFAVGIRPCTGAVLVLIFAWTQGLFAAGVIATFAMALGTAITVSSLAAFAVGSRELATRLTRANPVWRQRVQATAGIIGSCLLLILGLMFFIASLGPAQPF